MASVAGEKGWAVGKSGLSAAWLVLAVVAIVLGLLAVGRSVSGSGSSTLVLGAVAAAAATVVGLGVLVLWSTRDAIALSREARDGARQVRSEVQALRSELTEVRHLTDDVMDRLADLATSASRTHEGLDDVDGRVAALTSSLDVLAAGVEQAALDDTRATLDLASGLADLRERLDVDHASTSTDALSRGTPERR